MKGRLERIKVQKYQEYVENMWFNWNMRYCNK